MIEGVQPKEESGENNIQETNIGKKLSDFTTKRVVIVVLLVMISMPVFSYDTYVQTSGKYKFMI